jgi:hypothetical protein
MQVNYIFSVSKSLMSVILGDRNRITYHEYIVSVMHRFDDRRGVKQNNQVLGKHAKGVYDQFFLGEPNGPRLRHSKRTADHADIDIVQLVGSLTSWTRRVPGTSGVAEQTTPALGNNSATLACAAAPLATSKDLPPINSSCRRK